MKVLYAIQGTGNGHLSRAKSIIPILLSKNIDLDLLVSGTQADILLPYPVKYTCHGLSFIFGKKGGIDKWRTYLTVNASRLKKEIYDLPITEYDLVINDFEPVSAWAAKIKNVPCVGFSHQCAVIDEASPKAVQSDVTGKFILKKYAPCEQAFGLHFEAYTSQMFTPVIRDEIRQRTPSQANHYSVYLPSYSDDKLIQVFSQIKGVQWEIFSKHTTKAHCLDNLKILPICNSEFVDSLVSCKGIICGAGFETPAEALFLKKKLMVIPMKGQYEQQCNAAALKKMGVPVLKTLKEKHLPKIKEWVDNATIIPVEYPNQTEQIIDDILEWGLLRKIKRSKVAF